METSLPTSTISIRGVITLTAHAHQTSPDGGTEGLTPQMKTSVMSGGKLLEVPFLTANSVRGMLRRAASDVLVEKILQAKEQISRNLYLSLKRGAYSRTGMDAGGASYMQMLAANSHVFAGLFGGGAYMYPSKLRIERDLFPMLEATRELFPDRYQALCADVQPFQILRKILIASRDDFQRLPEGALIENADEAYAEHMAAKFGANLAKKAQKADAKADGQIVAKSEKLKTTDLNTFTQVEAIIPGTPFYLGLTARHVNDGQIGLLLTAIQSWANANALGGGSCRGRGSFKASLSLLQGDQVLTDQLLVGDAGSYTLSEKTAQYTAALEQALLHGDARAQKLASIYPSEIKMVADDKPAKAKAAKGAEAEA